MDFNTSNVTIQQGNYVRNVGRQTNFNTSNVTIQPRTAHQGHRWK